MDKSKVDDDKQVQMLFEIFKLLDPDGQQRFLKCLKSHPKTQVKK